MFEQRQACLQSDQEVAEYEQNSWHEKEIDIRKLDCSAETYISTSPADIKKNPIEGRKKGHTLEEPYSTVLWINT